MLQKLKYFHGVSQKNVASSEHTAKPGKVVTIISAGQVDIVLWRQQTLAIFHAV